MTYESQIERLTAIALERRELKARDEALSDEANGIVLGLSERERGDLNRELKANPQTLSSVSIIETPVLFNEDEAREAHSATYATMESFSVEAKTARKQSKDMLTKLCKWAAKEQAGYAGYTQAVRLNLRRSD